MSVDLIMFPELPTPNKVLFPKVIPQRLFKVEEVTFSQDKTLFFDLTMFAELPTPANIPEYIAGVVEEELVLSFFELEETTSAVLTINTN